MSIEELERAKESFIRRKQMSKYVTASAGIEGDTLDIGLFMEYTISLFKDQSDEMAELRKELAQKEDAIVVDDKTKVGGTD